jgi:hypothetical protein
MKIIAGALGLCLLATGVNVMAWRAGYAGNAIGLLGCHFLRTFLLLGSGYTAIAAIKTAATREPLAAQSRFTTVETIAFTCLLITGCIGCSVFWPAILLLLSTAAITVIYLKKPDSNAVLSLRHLIVVVVMFTVTWYLCATVTRQAFYGLGARIEAKGGAAKLKAWAAGVIAARIQREKAFPVLAASSVGMLTIPGGNGTLAVAAALIDGKADDGRPTLSAAEIPTWVDDIMGPFQGIRSVGIYLRPGGVLFGGDDPCIVMWSGGSAYSFRIVVRPWGGTPSPPWWIGAIDGMEWQPGIYLSTEGK